MKINWLKVTLIVAGLAATPFVLLVALIAFWIYASQPVHQPFKHHVLLGDANTLIVSGDYIKDSEEVRCDKTIRYEYQRWSKEDERPVEELIGVRQQQDYIDACDIGATRPRIVQTGWIDSIKVLRLDDTVYSRLPQRGMTWRMKRFDPLHYRIERFSPETKTIVLALRPEMARPKVLPRLVMRADSSGNWKRDVSASRRLCEPFLYPHGHLQATFVWARLPHDWHRKLADWDGQGDLRARLRQLKARIVKVEIKPFEQRTESLLQYGKRSASNDPLRAIARWNSEGQISVHDTFGFWSAGPVNRWNIPPDESGAPGPAAFIWLGKTSPFAKPRYRSSRHRD